MRPPCSCSRGVVLADLPHSPSRSRADHGGNNPDSLLVKLEWEEFTEGIKLDGADKVWWDYRPLFRTKNARWRMSMVLLISIFGQFSGNGLGYFNVSSPR